MTKKHKTQVYLVELINQTDRADDEAWKVRAINKVAAKYIVEAHALRRGKVGAVVLARGNIHKKDRDTAAHLRSICVRSV